jgi:vancomycin resistance protein YoaR
MTAVMNRATRRVTIRVPARQMTGKMTSPFHDRRTTPAKRWFLGVFAAGGILTALAFFAVLDARIGQGRVQRNVWVAGSSVGRMNGPELTSFLENLEGRYRTMNVGVAAPEGGFSVTGADLGVKIDRKQLAAELMAVGHEGGAMTRISTYASSFFNKTSVEVPITVDPTAVSVALATHDTKNRIEPVDPKLVVQDDGFAIRPGRVGTGISGDVIVASLPLLVKDGPSSPTIAVDRVPLPERYSEEELKALVAKAEELTSKPLPVQIGDKSTKLSSKQLRSLVSPQIINGRVKLTLDPKKALKVVTTAIGSVGTQPQDARLKVNDDGTVSAVPSQVGQVCCEADAIDRLDEALASGSGKSVELKLKTVEPKISTEKITQLGVKELISTFTTKHPPGEDRVKNIHHIADLIQGYVILPGETFSVNALIGPRTAANGFVKAHVIEDGVFAENFGGGISQFATTTFNTAFFAGLDLVEYQSHSLYISRYPYGREATLSFPAPDLKVHNNTPYGILVWPTYTDRSLTVSFYSTKYVTGEVGEQTVEKRDQCKRVYTTRIRTYVDGRAATTDRVVANYRPKEGVNCKGLPTAGATTSVPKTSSSKPKTTKPKSTADAGTDPGTADTSKPVQAGGGNSGGGDSGSNSGDTRVVKPKPRPKTTKASGGDAPPDTKAPKKPDPKPEPKPDPKPEPTSPQDDGGVTPAKPPVTGLG